MRKLCFYIVLVLCLVHKASAQYTFGWMKKYVNDSVFEATSLALMPGGNLVITGTVRNGNTHTWLQKINPKGKILWTIFYSGYPVVVPNDVAITSDSSIVIVGYNGLPETGDRFIWLAKFSHSGKLLWERTYNNFGYSYGVKVKVTPEGGYVIAANISKDGTEPFDWLLIKTDSVGFIQWYRTEGSKYNDLVNDLAVLPNNTYALAGFYRDNKGNNKLATISIYDSAGNNIAYRKLRYWPWSEATAIAPTADTAIVIAGFYKNPLTGNDVFVAKLDSLTDSVWVSTLQLPLQQIPFSLIQAYDKSFVVAFTLWTSQFPYTDLGIAQFSKTGKLTYLRLLRRGSDDFVAQLVEGKDNGIYLLASVYMIDIGWTAGLIKCNTVNRSDLIFIVPAKAMSAYYKSKITIKACVKGYDVPKKVEVWLNGQLVDTVTNFTVTTKKKCPFYFQTDLNLKLGINRIVFKVIDYKDYKFVRKRTVFYIPLPRRRW